MGEYSLFDSSKSIWVFVKSEEKNSRYYPQSLDSCHPIMRPCKKADGKPESTLGDSSDTGRFFDIIVTLADEKANQKMRNLLYEWWCPDYKGNRSNAGFQNLPDGVHETERIRVKRSNESWNSSQNISNIRLPGKVNIVDLKRDTAPSVIPISITPSSPSGSLLMENAAMMPGIKSGS